MQGQPANWTAPVKRGLLLTDNLLKLANYLRVFKNDTNPFRPSAQMIYVTVVTIVKAYVITMESRLRCKKGPAQQPQLSITGIGVDEMSYKSYTSNVKGDWQLLVSQVE